MKDKKKLLKITGAILFLIIYTTLLVILIPLITTKPVIPIEDEKTPTSAGYITISQENEDIKIIPDKYNTGAKLLNTLKSTNSSDSISGVSFATDASNTKTVLEFAYKNTTTSGVVKFENIDFSGQPFVLQNEQLVTRNITLVFNNCIFDTISTGKADSTISLEFNNCTIRSFSGSNATFNKCRFGGSAGDAINPFRNIYVNDCYIADMSYTLDTGIVHTDGTQIYGIKDLDATNIYFQNCRFEIPQLVTSTNNAYVNACIMIQLEYSNGRNIAFDNCYINGGGYSIYAWAKNSNYSLSNVKLSNINVGATRKYGQIYNTVSPGVTFENINDTSSLYVASVWKDTAGTHLSVTNDTNTSRTLLVVTDKGEFKFDIAACPKSDEVTSSQTFNDFPFDIDTLISSDCQWLVCYDITGGSKQQIRFVNWGAEPVTILDQSLVADSSSDLAAAPVPVAPIENITESIVSTPKNTNLLEGMCGANVSYTLTSDGTLTLIGTGPTYNYSSTKNAPWYEYSSKVTTLNITEGITVIGSQLFRGFSSITEVNIPEGVTNINTNAFINSTNLSTLYLPSTLLSIGGFAFYGTALTNVYYNDTELKFTSITKGSYNDPLLKANYSFYNPIIGEGTCGANIKWTLADNGVLTLTGSGSTYDYTSSKVAPWNDFTASVKSVIISEDITVLGNQLFRGCSNISSVSLPSTLTTIKNNVLISCSALKTITIPQSLTSIGSYSFLGTSLTDVYYLGTKDQWSKIKIGSYNTPLTKANIITN